MKSTITKGFLLGLSLVLCNTMLSALIPDEIALPLFSALAFFAITTAFVVSDSVSEMFLTGFTGAFFMFAIQIALLICFPGYIEGDFLISYIGGFWGCMASVAAGLYLTNKRIKNKEEEKVNNDSPVIKEGSPELSPKLKGTLIICAILSALFFIIFVTPVGAGVSIPVFTVLEFILFYFAAPSKKKLWLFIPIFAISLNSFISASDLWDMSNIIVSIVLYACIFAELGLFTDSLSYFGDMLSHIFYPLSYFSLPFKWASQIDKKKAPYIKRACIAAALGIAASSVLVVLLSNADMVFSMKSRAFADWVTNIFDAKTLGKVILGVLAGLYVFGILYRSHTHKNISHGETAAKAGDLIIINTVLSFVLAVYTLFVIVQFKYLFAGATLPEGLSYTEYARKGFFELLALTGVNIAGIYIVTMFTKGASGKWKKLSVIFCHYLCGVTCVLLASSFYRMLLYTGSDGLTRLRLFVLGFLVFEAIGLIFTFIYIARPKFNIVMVYTLIALSYYCLLNVLPTDYFIAKNQVDKFLAGERDDVNYVFTLSADAAPAMRYLADNTDDTLLAAQAERFITRRTEYYEKTDDFRSYNLSHENAKALMQKTSE